MQEATKRADWPETPKRKKGGLSYGVYKDSNGQKNVQRRIYPGVFDCTVGEFIQQRERLGVPTQEFKTCFICGRHLAMNRIPIVISVSGKGNRFACDKCYEKSQREKEHEKTEL